MRELSTAWLVRLAIVAAVQFTPAAVSAEPINVTSGAIAYSRQNVVDIRFAGDGVSVFGQFGDGTGESWDPNHALFCCMVGSVIDLSQNETFPYDPATSRFAGGSVAADGTYYFFNSLDLSLAADTFVIPDTTSEYARFDAGRFVFRSAITGTSDAGVTRTFDFTGSGRAFVSLGFNQWFATSYEFSDPAAVPEPGTLLLVGGGALMAAVRRRKAVGSRV